MGLGLEPRLYLISVRPGGTLWSPALREGLIPDFPSHGGRERLPCYRWQLLNNELGCHPLLVMGREVANEEVVP